MQTKTAYDFSLPSLDGSSLTLGDYKNHPLLLVNTASKCGFTPQYEGLQAVWSRYKKQGLIVIGIPSNEFGHQEPADNKEIAAFCHKNYGVSFPMAAKSPIKGNGRIPLFQWLAEQGGLLSLPRWNFYKYIINRQGQLATWFTSLTPPVSKRCVMALEKTIYDF
ncbi:glutathione peroxidase [Entomobacter blattae]|uniref:Glutathione peroxidase n=1 Tax=Entomobacter blattae TaxID=2762277 RepID=A0A7H1NRU6_9PROT|nr:glutathione peroxidase [Entomobacter blattae]QNT78506.1 Glutathione peroxidase BsaA [Entomobacter blattae]